MLFELDGNGNKMVEVITPDGRTGFDKHGQLWSWTARDVEGRTSGHLIRDVRGCTCYICGQGWELTTERLKDQMFDDERIMHHTCFDGHLKINARNDIRNALIEAQFLFNLEEVPPRYPHSTPWQRVKVLCNDRERSDSNFRIVIGRRKRVWELRLHGCSDVSKKFEDVNDTKGYEDGAYREFDDPEFGPYYYVHAWTKHQMVDYLDRFRQLIPASIDRALV